jgi:hypothetical protein
MNSCKTAQPQHTAGIATVSFVVLQQGNLYGAGEEEINSGLYTANEHNESLALVEKMNRINVEIDTAKLPKKEFYTSSSLLFIFDAVRGSGGHTISVENIITRNDTLFVQAKKHAPEGPASTVMTQPYTILSIEKPTVTVQLEFIE